MQHKTGLHALNKLQWCKDGSKILTGDCSGNLRVLNIDSQILHHN